MPPRNTQFSIAVHLMARLGFVLGEQMRSQDLAASINASPSFVRRILSKLSKAGLVRAKPGRAGTCAVARDPGNISLLDIYKAIGGFELMAIHVYPSQKCCPVSCHFKGPMERVLRCAQEKFENDLQGISLAAVIADIKKQK